MFTVAILSILSLAVPLVFIAWLWMGKGNGTPDWVLRVSATGAAVLFSILAGTWGYLSYYLKFPVLILYIISVVQSYSGLTNRLIFARRERHRFGFYLKAIVLAVFLFLDFLVLKGAFSKVKSVELSFPLKSGSYYVLQGGNSPVTNLFHYANPAQRHALDIVKLYKFGNRANGLFPGLLSRYAIYGDTLYSPCMGVVVEAFDGLPDNYPNNRDADNPSGNHIVINCKGVNVLLAHLENTSILIKQGDPVREGQPIGQVGNSGDSLEPHLHIHAVAENSGPSPSEGKAVPISFKGRPLRMNRVLVN